MNIKQTTNTPLIATKLKAPAAQAQEKATQSAPAESVTFSGSKSPGDVGWLDVGKGLVGAVAAAAIETVGNTASSIPQAIQLVAEGEVALVKNGTIGPWLKTGIGLLAPVAGALAVAGTAIGSLGYGLYRGFTEGIQNGVGGAIGAAVSDVKDFNTELAAGARESIREFGNEKLAEGEEKFDVSPVRAGIGVVAGVGTTVQGAAQFGWTTIKNIPEAFSVGNKAISKSEMSTPLKAASHALSLPLAAVAAPLAVVGGAAVGLGVGIYEGYREGFTDSFKKINEWNNEYDKHADKFLNDAAEELAKGDA